MVEEQAMQETSVKVDGKLSWFLWLGLFFNPKDGGDMFLRNVHCLSTVYTVLYPRR
jgi:hypothetical protein